MTNKINTFKELKEALENLYNKKVQTYKVADFDSPFLGIINDFKIKTIVRYDFEKDLLEIEFYEVYNNEESLMCSSECPQKIYEFLKIRKECGDE